MNVEPIFTFNPEAYTRNLDIVGGYVTQAADYLHRVTGDSLEKTTNFIKQNIKPDGLFPIQDPAIIYLSKESRGNKQLYTPNIDDDPTKDYSRHDHSFLRYLNRVQTAGLIIAPTLTVTFPPRFKKSLLASYIGQNLKLRKTYKGKMLELSVVGDLDGEVFYDILQTTCKIKNNSLSGAHSSPSTPIYNKSSHSILTSTCRCATSYGNANNEKFLMGNRHYWCPDIVISNIFSIIQNTDYDALTLAMNKYQLVYPDTNAIMECIEYSSKPYWRSEQHMLKIRSVVDALNPYEKAAFLFVGDMYHFDKLNHGFVKEMLLQLATVIKVDSIQDPESILKTLDDYTTSFANSLCFEFVSGKKLKDIKANEWNNYCSLAATGLHIKTTLEFYRDLFLGLFRPKVLSPSINMLPNIVRRAVVTSDTDSSIFSNAYWVKRICGKMGFGPEEFRLGNTTTYLTAQLVRHQLALLSSNLGIEAKQIHTLTMKNEFYFNIFCLTPVAKHYMAYMNAREGSVYSSPKLEIKGVELRSSNAPDQVMEMVKDYICYVFDMITQTGDTLSMKEILKPIYELEKDIYNDIQNGGYKYLRTMSIKDPESYIDAEDSSAYRQHLFWQNVFAPVYGYVDDPPYSAIKVSVNLRNKKSIDRWLDSIEDVVIKENLKKHFLSTNYNQMSTILLPEPIVAGYGVPKEILMVADSRKLIMGIVSPFYLILESLGIFLRNKNMTKMVLDFYDDRFSAGLPYREFAGLQKCIDA